MISKVKKSLMKIKLIILKIITMEELFYLYILLAKILITITLKDTIILEIVNLAKKVWHFSFKRYILITNIDHALYQSNPQVNK